MRTHCSDDEATLIQRIRIHIQDPLKVFEYVSLATETQNFEPTPYSISVLSQAEIDEAETKLGFRLPPLLRELYLQIGDGGFGPGYGLFSMFDEGERYNIVPDALGMRNANFEPPYSGYNFWNPEHLLICDWGSGIQSAIDCATPDGAIYRYDFDDYNLRTPVNKIADLESPSLYQWLSDWIAGKALFQYYETPNK